MGGEEEEGRRHCLVFGIGLQVAISLKAENFPDSKQKPLVRTSRTASMNCKTRSVRFTNINPARPLLASFSCLWMLFETVRIIRVLRGPWPSFGRGRVGRLSSPGQLNRLVGHSSRCVPDGPERAWFFIDVANAPPKTGRPKIDTTMTLESSLGRWPTISIERRARCRVRQGRGGRLKMVGSISRDPSLLIRV